MPPRKKDKGKAPDRPDTGRSTHASPADEDTDVVDAPDLDPVADETSRDVAGGRGRVMTNVEARQLADAAGAIFNPTRVPSALGSWYWQNPLVDAPLARAFGMQNPLQATIARENGELLEPESVAERFNVVFVPDPRFRNIDYQPAGRGGWEYLTPEARNLAHMNLGNQDLFPDEAEPTPEAVWEARQRIRRRIQAGEAENFDPTDDIDIVWVPAAGETPDRYPEPRGPDIEPPGPTGLNIESSESGEGRGNETSEDEDQLTHAPMNRGENDQTGVPGDRIWQTIMINGKKITIDRSRAKRGSSAGQQHKTWAVDHKGNFFQWKQANSIDWKDAGDVNKLNHWREQIFSRQKFPKKREGTREPYNEAETKYLNDLIEHNTREKLRKNIKLITKSFNQKFRPRVRSEDALLSAIDRLIKKKKTKSSDASKDKGTISRKSPRNHPLPKSAETKKPPSKKPPSKKGQHDESDSDEANDDMDDSPDREDDELPKREDDEDEKP